MRRCFTVILLLLLLIWCVSAFADVVLVDQSSITVICDNLVSGNFYSLLTVKGHSSELDLSADSVLYVNQLAADEAGSFSITFIHFDLPDCRFLVGGAFPEDESPRFAGLYTLPSDIAQALPQSLSEIKDEAFAGSAFEQVIIGDKVKSIGAYAFRDCSRLSRISIPSSVTKIADNAFDGCSHLTVECSLDSAAYNYALLHNYTISIR